MSYHKPDCPEANASYERAYDIAQDVLKRMRLANVDGPTADAVFVEIAAIGARAAGLTVDEFAELARLAYRKMALAIELGSSSLQ